MRTLRSNWWFVVTAGLLSAACSGESGKDNVAQGAYPACGTDPAKQPAKCLDEGGALRCKVNTGMAGDEFALCEPDPNDGLLIHMGPTDYSDPTQMQAYTLAPGGEEEFCLKVNTSNTELKDLKAYHGRMRPHSHHLIVTETTQIAQSETTPVICQPIGAVTERWLLASQWPTFDVASVSGGGTAAKPGDPDYGLSRDIKTNETLNMDLHYANTSDQPILREAWATLEYLDPSEVKVKLDVISWINLQISVPPLGHAVTPRFSTTTPSDAQGPMYLGFTTAHAHKRLVRLSLYYTPAGGTETLIYEDHDSHQPGAVFYRDGLQNPGLPVGSGSTWGSKSGYLKINPGDTFSFECEYQNTDNYTVTFGETTKQEMCNVFGFYYPTLGHTWTVVQ